MALTVIITGIIFTLVTFVTFPSILSLIAGSILENWTLGWPDVFDQDKHGYVVLVLNIIRLILDENLFSVEVSPV